ncbi:hypothetical protein V2J09_020579 [Rumex salicifolius]
MSDRGNRRRLATGEYGISRASQEEKYGNEDNKDQKKATSGKSKATAPVNDGVEMQQEDDEIDDEEARDTGGRLMNPMSVFNSTNALQGIHGVHVRTHAPFSLDEIDQNGDHCQPTFTSSSIQTSQEFLVKKNMKCKLYANSLIGVGVASSLYHSSRGRIRKYLRWVDYTMIAATTVCLSRAIRRENPKLLMAASALCLPFQPLMVSVVHTGMMEVAFAKRAVENPKLRSAHTMHKLSSLLGVALFVADDVFGETPYIHAAWHLAAAAGVSTCNKLLE